MPSQIFLSQQNQYRIIPSVYPPINFFEDLVNPEDMEALWKIESLTNERLLQEAGDIFLVSPEDRVSGPGSSVVMAAFTHIGKQTRFTDGSYGIYYASFSKHTAVKETIYHRERFLRHTNEEACEIQMRVYVGKLAKPFHDLRSKKFNKYLHPENYSLSQQYAKDLREKKSWGIIYNSVRDSGGTCIAALRPPAITIPKEQGHLRYVWNGQKIINVLEIKQAVL